MAAIYRGRIPYSCDRGVVVAQTGLHTIISALYNQNSDWPDANMLQGHNNMVVLFIVVNKASIVETMFAVNAMLERCNNCEARG
jgi:hypothetical protein